MAIMKYCEYVVGDVMGLRARYPKAAEIPFNSTNKYQVRFSKEGGMGKKLGVDSREARRQRPPARDEGGAGEDPLAVLDHPLEGHQSPRR